MTKGVWSAAVFTAALFAWPGAAAGADPIQTSLAVTVNPLNGEHEVGQNGSDRFTFAPLPLAELTLRRGTESLRIEGLPPIAFNYGSGAGPSVESRTTRLSILNATYRQAFAGGWFAGIGETVYTQHTDYANIPQNYYYYRDGQYYYSNGSESEYSRVAGLRLEAGRTLKAGRNTLEFGAAYNPSMHGTEHLVIPNALLPGSFSSCSFGTGTDVCSVPTAPTFTDPEAATQVDGYVRVAHRVSRNGEMLLGVRYINFTAHYSNNSGELADRNVGWAPVLGYRLHL